MSIHPPPKGWFRPPAGGERMWIGIGLVWCLVLFAAMPYAHFKGKQNATGEAYSVDPFAFAERTREFAKANKVDEIEGIPIAEPAPGGDAYLLGQMWRWYPVLKLKEGQTYRLHLSSVDLQLSSSCRSSTPASWSSSRRNQTTRTSCRTCEVRRAAGRCACR